MRRKVYFKNNKQTSPPVLNEPDPRAAIVGRLHPHFLVKGKGAYVWSDDGRKYIDCALGWGSVILGHANRQVNNAVKRQAKKGTTFTGPSPVSLEVAELIVKMVPCAQNLRFGKNGSDATLAAVRIARSLTGREKIARCGYHGFHDWSMADDWCNRGVPKCLHKEILRFEFNDVSSLQKVILPYADEIAAIVIDPLANNLAERAYLAAARELADQTGALLIFDEIMSGFRISRGGIQEIYGIQPDIVCLGKALANGMPLSVIAGKEEILKEFGNIWYGLTFEQDSVSLAAAKACLQIIPLKTIVAAQATLDVDVSVKNTGDSNWLPSASEFGGVNLGGHLFDERERLLNHDFYRHHLPPPDNLSSGPGKNDSVIQPGDSIRFNCRVPVPESKGKYFNSEVATQQIHQMKDVSEKIGRIKASAQKYHMNLHFDVADAVDRLLKGRSEYRNAYLKPAKGQTLTKACCVPWEIPFINKDGNVFRCSNTSVNSSYIMGNLESDDFEEIWCNEKFRKFRENLLSGTPTPKICDTCVVAPYGIPPYVNYSARLLPKESNMDRRKKFRGQRMKSEFSLFYLVYPFESFAQTRHGKMW